MKPPLHALLLLLLARLLAAQDVDECLPCASGCGMCPPAGVSRSATYCCRPDYPLFLQCDERWGNNEMGVKGNGERNTICHEGCAMTSLSMALRGLNITVAGKPADPGVLNSYLEANNGYVCKGGDCNNLVLDAPDKFTNGRLKFIAEAPITDVREIQRGLDGGNTIYLAHVRHNSHFVLLVDYLPERKSFWVNDPFYPVQEYPVKNITDIIQYRITDKQNRYPEFKQCDTQWGNDTMGSNGLTICKVGCLMSSTSEALRWWGVPIPGHGASNPGTLNAWLRENGGYAQGTSDLIESVIPKLNPARVTWPSDAMHKTNDLAPGTVRQYIEQGRAVIANVLHGEHFVLAVGLSTDLKTLYVRDSGFDRDSYEYDSVVGWRIYDIV